MMILMRMVALTSLWSSLRCRFTLDKWRCLSPDTLLRSRLEELPPPPPPPPPRADFTSSRTWALHDLGSCLESAFSCLQLQRFGFTSSASDDKHLVDLIPPAPPAPPLPLAPPPPSVVEDTACRLNMSLVNPLFEHLDEECEECAELSSSSSSSSSSSPPAGRFSAHATWLSTLTWTSLTPPPTVDTTSAEYSPREHFGVVSRELNKFPLGTIQIGIIIRRIYRSITVISYCMISIWGVHYSILDIKY